MVSAPVTAAAEAARLGAQVEAATERLLATAAEITDEQARQPSLLPGWSRGHVLTHIARNADGLRNMLTWARTGVVTPQYPSLRVRNEQIEAGAGRRAAELAADVALSAAAFAAEAGTLGNEAWSAEVRGLRGAAHPAWYTLWRRLSEVEIHHVDLAAGYQPADWPAEFAVDCVRRVASAFSGPDCPAALLRVSDDGSEHRIGPPGAAPVATVAGPVRPLLAWLTGRSAGAGLTAEPAGPLPALPAW